MGVRTAQLGWERAYVMDDFIQRLASWLTRGETKNSLALSDNTTARQHRKKLPLCSSL